jgi:hypothetical protein
MSPIGHLQYGWWFAHWGKFGRRERAIIALAGAGPDLDGLSLLAGGDAFLKYHHILFHNVGAVAGAVVIAGALLWRKPGALLLTVFAFAMHIVEYYIVSDQHLAAVSRPPSIFRPPPNWVVRAFQYTAMAFIVVCRCGYISATRHAARDLFLP